MRSWFGGKGTAIAAFGLVAALVLGGLWWMTEAALRLEAEQGEVRAAVDLNSRLRIALWRLDGRISPVLAQESARPFEHYSAVYVPAAALDAHGAAWPAGAILEPSPLLDAALPSWLTLHFQFQPDARVVSPQAPPEALLERLREAEVAVGNVTPIKQAALADLQAVLDPVRLTALLPPPKVEPSLPVPPGELVYQTAANAPPAFEPNAEGNVELQQALSPSQTPDADPFQQSGQTAPVSPSGPGGSAGGGDETGATSHPNAASLPQPPGTQPPTYTTRTVPPGAFPSGASGGMSADDPGRGGSANGEGSPGGGGFGGGGAGYGLPGQLGGGQGGNQMSPSVQQLEANQPVGPGLQFDVAVQQIKDLPDPNVASQQTPAQQQAFPQQSYSQQAVSPQGDYARRVAQRGAVAKDVVINSMKPGKSYNAYANDVNLDWLANETGGNAYATVPEAPVEVGPLTPVWLPRRGKQPGEDDLLVAARLVRLGDRVVCQGVLIDWPTLRDELVREIKDLFPAAQLLAGRTATADALERTMTALPLQLDPSETRSIAAVGWSPLRTGVVIAWTAALAALVSAGLGGWSLWELSQRRIRFVSAVTHELRTPLTTLRLYLDMLTSGLVTDEERQSEYLQTLNAESDRLNRLITNVLEFSRLEGRRGNVQPRDVPIDALLADVEADWERRCRDAGKTLIVENALAGRTLLVDERLAQQILGILVDNACKYSRGAEDCRIWLRAASDGRGGAVFEVEDRGPGVPLAERRRVFQPFWRGRRDDAAAGGVGLGLTLAERWTSLLRGRLSVEPPRDASGACFRLQLPGLAEPTDSTSNFSPAAG